MTMSFGATSIFLTSPSCLIVIDVQVFFSPLTATSTSVTTVPKTKLTPLFSSSFLSGRMQESYWLRTDLATPSSVWIRTNSCVKRRRYLLNSAAECHGWNANVVDHMYQKFVWKKCGLKCSVILELPSPSSFAR